MEYKYKITVFVLLPVVGKELEFGAGTLTLMKPMTDKKREKTIKDIQELMRGSRFEKTRVTIERLNTN